MEKHNWQLTQPLDLIQKGIDSNKGIKVGINKITKEFTIYLPLIGFKSFEFNPTLEYVTLEGAEEKFMSTETFSEPMSLEELKGIITNNKIEV